MSIWVKYHGSEINCSDAAAAIELLDEIRRQEHRDRKPCTECDNYRDRIKSLQREIEALREEVQECAATPTDTPKASEPDRGEP
jgi:phage host-nuclease inhibitor protein Gam